MKESAHYAKIVEWSDEDQCYVGSAPGLIYGGCHGDDEQEVFADLCRIVEEAIDLYHQDGKPLPPATSNAADRMTTASERRRQALTHRSGVLPARSKLRVELNCFAVAIDPDPTCPGSLVGSGQS
jgi:predicted RNase H-like HicB family nuclease